MRKKILFNIFHILLINIITSLVFSGPTNADCGYPIRIMPLGDSITYGWDGGYGGYRGYLGDLLYNGGYDFDFVGSRTDNDPCTDPNCPFLDLDHEGWNGWRADQIRDNIFDGPGGGN